MNRVIYDIDNTLTLNASDKPYSEKSVHSLWGEAPSLVSNSGMEVGYYTARNMKTYSEDLEAIRSNTKPLLDKWLSDNDFPLGSLYIGKPYCGKSGIYVDDRAVSPTLHMNCLKNGWFDKKIVLIVICYNISDSYNFLIQDLLELLPALPNLQVHIVDNGSIDDTFEILSKYADAYPALNVIRKKVNAGYGGGVVDALKSIKASADYFCIAHGNSKYSINDFFRSVCFQLKCDPDRAVLTNRYGRAFSDSFVSIIQRLIFRVLLKLNYRDYIGAIRLVPSKYIDHHYISDQTPSDYLFDLWLALHLSSKHVAVDYVSLIERSFGASKSNWKHSRFSRTKMAAKYISFLFQRAVSK